MSKRVFDRSKAFRQISGARVAVAGAGVFGLCTALGFARAGAEVTVFDPSAIGANASGVAAGMIAPFGELLYDHLDPDLWPLFLAARDAWRPLEAVVPGLALQRRGCSYFFDDAATAEGAGALARRLQIDASRALVGPGLQTEVDWWLDPRAALRQLLNALRDAGGVHCAQPLPLDANVRFDAVVLCIGPAFPGLAELAPTLSNLSPIKGHLVCFEGAPSAGGLVRRPDLYLTPQPYGVVAGATMEAGERDPRVDPHIVEALRIRAIVLRPELARYSCVGAAGVRMAAADGLPVVGPDPISGVLAAAGARRNGWLLGPLVAEILLAYFTGAPISADALRLAPARLLDGAV